MTVSPTARLDPVDGAGNLNALQWGFYSCGALVGDLTEGLVYQSIGSAHVR